MIKLNNVEISNLEALILRQIEKIIFVDRMRPSGRKKRNGGLVIEDKTGNLRSRLKANRGFLKQTERGFEINVEMVNYYKWLDDSRRDELNWYLTEAIFEDKIIRDAIKKTIGSAAKRTVLNMILKK